MDQVLPQPCKCSEQLWAHSLKSTCFTELLLWEENWRRLICMTLRVSCGKIGYKSNKKANQLTRNWFCHSEISHTKRDSSIDSTKIGDHDLRSIIRGWLARRCGIRCYSIYSNWIMDTIVDAKASRRQGTQLEQSHTMMVNLGKKIFKWFFQEEILAYFQISHRNWLWKQKLHSFTFFKCL